MEHFKHRNNGASNATTKSSSKPQKPSKKDKKDLESIVSLQSDIASFASSLGLSSSLPSSGFNDSDFRKKGPLKAPKNNIQKPQINQNQNFHETHKLKTIKNRDTDQNTNFEAKPGKAQNLKDDSFKSQPTPKAPVLSLENRKNDSGNNKKFERFKSMPKLPLVKAGALGVWYVDAMELEKKVLSGGEREKKAEVKDVEEWKRVVEKKREIGERLMWQYSVDYESSRGQSGDIKMLAASQRSGTAADRVSAFSVMVGDNPLANMRSLDALLGMVTSKVGKRHALTGFETLKELFISSLLPDRKLKTLLQRPVNNLPETKDGYSLLLFWYWEECLKQRYERFVSGLEEASRDMLPALKDKSMRIIYALLKSKSEQERRLLSALVNKLGDPQNKGASNADFHLANLLSEHPNMKVVVIDEVDSFLFRPHLGLRAKYHAVNFLSQIRLSQKGDGPKAAKRLIDVYFALFKVLINETGGGQRMDKRIKEEDRIASGSSMKKNARISKEQHVELDSRLLSALLTGVNRAFPYVSSNESDDIIEVHTPMLFQLVHSKNFNVGVQALMLLDKISSKNQIVSDRFYRALYSKLLLPAAMNSSKAEMFIGLLLRAMKNDINLRRTAAFSKRLLQVALQQPPQFACGCLFLLSEVLKARPPLWNMVVQDESVDEDLEHFEDIVEETDNELGNASKQEEDDINSAHGDDRANSDSGSSEDEVGSSASDSDDDVSDEAEELLIREDAKDLSKPETVSDGKGHQPSTRSFLPGGFDPRHREPSYCNADRASWWELTVLAAHVHPSVATMAQTLLSGANIVYNGNPLNDLSLTAFLDKFMEKKPKQSTWHGGSKIEPAKKLDMNHNLIGPEILSLAEADVPPEDLVFHKFYTNKMNSAKKQKKKKKKGAEEAAGAELFNIDGDEVDGGDESDNEEIENMLDSANASLEAGSEYNYDDLDQVADEDDDDLIGDTSDAEMEALSDIAEGEDFDAIDDDGEGDDIDVDDDDDDVPNIREIDDRSDNEEEEFNQQRKRKRKRKSSRKAGASPFASLEEYEHLMNEDSPAADEPVQEKKNKKKHKSRKKRRSSE